MAEPQRLSDLFLRDVSTRLVGSGGTRRRLLTEIRDHLEDAIAANVEAGMQPALAEERAVELLGSPDALVRAWAERCRRLRTRRRGHAVMLVAAVATAAVLGVAQHADGQRNPTAPTAPTRACLAAQACEGHAPAPHADHRPG